HRGSRGYWPDCDRATTVCDPAIDWRGRFCCYNGVDGCSGATEASFVGPCPGEAWASVPPLRREYRVATRVNGSIGRGLLALAAAAMALSTGVGSLSAGSETRHHALSLVGEPAYGPDFKHFDWVNPDAPKGGTVRQWAMGSFDSLNPFSVQGS